MLFFKVAEWQWSSQIWNGWLKWMTEMPWLGLKGTVQEQMPVHLNELKQSINKNGKLYNPIVQAGSLPHTATIAPVVPKPLFSMSELFLQRFVMAFLAAAKSFFFFHTQLKGEAESSLRRHRHGTGAYWIFNNQDNVVELLDIPGTFGETTQRWE